MDSDTESDAETRSRRQKKKEVKRPDFIAGAKDYDAELGRMRERISAIYTGAQAEWSGRKMNRILRKTLREAQAWPGQPYGVTRAVRAVVQAAQVHPRLSAFFDAHPKEVGGHAERTNVSAAHEYDFLLVLTPKLPECVALAPTPPPDPAPPPGHPHRKSRCGVKVTFQNDTCLPDELLRPPDDEGTTEERHLDAGKHLALFRELVQTAVAAFSDGNEPKVTHNGPEVTFYIKNDAVREFCKVDVCLAVEVSRQQVAECLEGNQSKLVLPDLPEHTWGEKGHVMCHQGAWAITTCVYERDYFLNPRNRGQIELYKILKLYRDNTVTSHLLEPHELTSYHLKMAVIHVGQTHGRRFTFSRTIKALRLLDPEAINDRFPDGVLRSYMLKDEPVRDAANRGYHVSRQMAETLKAAETRVVTFAMFYRHLLITLYALGVLLAPAYFAGCCYRVHACGRHVCHVLTTSISLFAVLMSALSAAKAMNRLCLSEREINLAGLNRFVGGNVGFGACCLIVEVIRMGRGGTRGEGCLLTSILLLVVLALFLATLVAILVVSSFVPSTRHPTGKNWGLMISSCESVIFAIVASVPILLFSFMIALFIPGMQWV